jgi:predicted DNA-binding antitoxin AbrB/MazE fold protein
VLSLSGVSNGTHSIGVRSRDAAGNWSGTVTKNVVVDKTVSASVSALPAITTAATVPLTFTKDADGVKAECAMDGGAYAVCSSGWSGISAASADGTHSYKVRVTDDVGNVAETAAVSTTIDRTLPVLAFTDGPAEGQQVVTSNAAITFSLVEARPNTVKCKLDAGAWNACSAGTPVQLVGLTDGTHVLSVQAVDLAGNTRTISRTFGVKVPASGGGETPAGGGETPTGGGQTPTGGGGQTPSGGGTPSTPTTPQARALNVRFTHDYVYVGKRTKFTSLAVAGLPKTAKVTVVCKGGGCKGKSKTLKHSGGKLNVLKALKSLVLKQGAKVTVTVRGEGNAQAVATYVIRKGKRPTDTYRCAKAGGKLAAC